MCLSYLYIYNSCSIVTYYHFVITDGYWCGTPVYLSLVFFFIIHMLHNKLRCIMWLWNMLKCLCYAQCPLPLLIQTIMSYRKIFQMWTALSISFHIRYYIWFVILIEVCLKCCSACFLGILSNWYKCIHCEAGVAMVFPTRCQPLHS